MKAKTKHMLIMRKILPLLLLMLPLVGVLAACNEVAEPDPHDREGVAGMTVEILTAAELGRLDAYHELIDHADEGNQRVMITTDAPVRDFRFVEIRTVFDDNDQVEFIEGRTLHVMHVFSPETPFAANWMVEGASPHRGISFIDESGASRHFYISYHIDTGGVELVEFYM